MKGVDVSAVCIIPEMIFYEHLHSDLSFWHAGIINQTGPGVPKFSSGFNIEIDSVTGTGERLVEVDLIRLPLIRG